MKNIICAMILTTGLGLSARGQATSGRNPISTAVPFLTISPDARSAGIGDAGVALDADVNANFWNPSKLAFLDSTKNYLSLSYSPWLRSVSSDANLGYLSFGKKLDERNAVGLSFRYFNLGKINTYDDNEAGQGVMTPNEFSVDVSLARKFGQEMSLGVSLRYIHSGLYQGSVNGLQYQPGNAVAADVSIYWKKQIRLFGEESNFAFGGDVSNIGSKVTYQSGNRSYFLPTNLKLGVANTWQINGDDHFTFAFDINKLLVPTPPLRDGNGNIIAGKDDNRSVVSGIFGSFTDAPGGFSEQVKEFMLSPGAEYVFNAQLALRAGYFYDAPSKGDRQYFTFGAGYVYRDIRIDMSYLAAAQSNSPLANTLRFSLGYNFGGIK